VHWGGRSSALRVLDPCEVESADRAGAALELNHIGTDHLQRWWHPWLQRCPRPRMISVRESLQPGVEVDHGADDDEPRSAAR